MRRSLRILVFALLALAGACGSLSQDDETQGWSAQRLYGEAKDAMVAKDWGKSRASAWSSRIPPSAGGTSARIGAARAWSQSSL